MGCSQSSSVNSISPVVRNPQEHKSQSLSALETTRNTSRLGSLANSTLATNNPGSYTSLVEGKYNRQVSESLAKSELSQVQLGHLVVISTFKSLEEPNTRTNSQREVDNHQVKPTDQLVSMRSNQNINQHSPQGLGYILECESNLEVSQAAEECFSRTIRKSSYSKQLPSSGAGRKSNFKPMLPVFDEDSRHESLNSSFSDNDGDSDQGVSPAKNRKFQDDNSGLDKHLQDSNLKSAVEHRDKDSNTPKQKKLLNQGIQSLMRKPSKDRWLAASPLNDKSISSEASIHSKRRSMALKMNQDLTFEKCRLQVNESIY